jgi:hypothetical protein
VTHAHSDISPLPATAPSASRTGGVTHEPQTVAATREAAPNPPKPGTPTA